MRRVVALLTDFGLKDNYVGVMKGVILAINPEVQILDISHSISRHDIRQAAFLLASSIYYFPKDTIFLVVVDPGVGSERKPISIKTKNYYFVGPDNGVLSVAAGVDQISKVTVLENKKYFLGPHLPLGRQGPKTEITPTFHGRDIFAPVAGHLSKRSSLSSLGKAVDKIKDISLPAPEIKKNFIRGEIIYIDKFGNLVTNIEKNCLESVLGGKFIAVLKGKKIKKLSSSYAENRSNEPFFIEGGFGYLEISVKNKSAKKYFAVKNNEKSKIVIGNRLSVIR